MTKIKRLEWSLLRDGSGYAGAIGDVQYRFVRIGWYVAEPFEYDGKSYAALADAQQAAQDAFEAYIRNTLESP